jgi:T5SS/PEP-CTERM-associated repeat protein
MKLGNAVFVFLFFAILACSCFAEDYQWNNSGGGIFGEPNNWTPTGVPGSSEGDIARFLLPGAYTVTFDTTYDNSAMRVDGSDVTFNLDGNRYFLYLPDDNSVVVGESGQGSLMVNNGEVVSRETVVGLYGGSVGSLALSGPDARYTAFFDENWSGVWIGMDGEATLAIRDNAHLMNGHGATAYNPGSNAVVEVNDIDSEWYVDGQFDMSVYGTTTVDIRNGGLVNIGNLTIATERGSSAQINIAGQEHESELHLHAGLENSLTIGRGGQAAIHVAGSKIWNQGSMTIGEYSGSSGVLEIHEGSWVDCFGSVAVGGTLDNPGGSGQIKIIDDNPAGGLGVDFTPTSAEDQFMVVWPLGTISMDGGYIEMEYAEAAANPIILRGGTLEGNGVIWAHVENRGGIVAPNDDQDNKVLEMGHNYSQDAAGTLKIAIGGQNPVSQYSHLRATRENYGQVSLDGILDVSLTNGFVPSYDDQFILISANTITGTFSNAVERYFFKDGSFDVIYDTTSEYNSVILTHYSAEPACPKYPLADINKDCTVDLADFAIFASEWLECNLVPDYYCFGGPIVL